MNPALAIFLHSHSYDRLYQAVSILLAGTSMGWSCHLFVFYQALASYMGGHWDDIRVVDHAESSGRGDPDLEPAWAERLEQRFETSNMPSLYQMLEKARTGEGELKIFACSSSVKILGLSVEDVRQKVDEVVGLPTMLKIAENATHTLYI